jgi:hypothetical protein
MRKHGFTSSKGKRFLSPPMHPFRLQGPPGLLFNGKWGLGVTQLGCEAYHSPDLVLRLRTREAILSPTINLCGMYRDNSGEAASRYITVFTQMQDEVFPYIWCLKYVRLS